MKWEKKNHLLFHMDFLLSTNFNGVTFIPLLFCVEACWWATIIPSSLGKFDVSVGDSFVLCQEDWCWYWCFCLPHCSAHLGLLLHVLCHTLVYLFSLQICFTIKSIKSVLTHWRVLFLNAVCVCCTGSGFPQTGLHSFNSLFYFFFNGPRVLKGSTFLLSHVFISLHCILCPHFWDLCYHTMPVFLYVTSLH